MPVTTSKSFANASAYINVAHAYIWHDDIYIDITQSRTELCSGTTWATRSHCEIQIPSAWSDNSVTVTANHGSFANGASAYLYVVDENGEVNANGFPVTIGAPPMDVTPPSAPSGLSVE